MIKLEKFRKEDFEIFKSWIKDSDELLQFAGSIFSFPINDQQLINYINDARRIPFKVILSENNLTIGHCELNLENQQPRLSRILIGNKELRNKGYGKLIVNKMLNLLFNKMEYESADLNVFEWNTNAIKCYEALGFKINESLDSDYNHKGIIWKAKNMQINKTTWNNKYSTQQ